MSGTSAASGASSAMAFSSLANNHASNQNQDNMPFNGDFIIVAEFCEQEGPVPIYVLPQDIQQSGNFSFDVNAFVLRMLASDHSRKPDPNGISGVGTHSWNRPPEDTMLILSEKKEKAVTYVHHFTLSDVFARGYVRPLCMSYVTAESAKITENFEEFVQDFSEISSDLKRGNWKIFVNDLVENVARISPSITTPPLAPSPVLTEDDDEPNENGLDEEILAKLVAELKTLQSRIAALPALDGFNDFLDTTEASSSDLLQKYMPQVFKFIHKTSNFEVKLRKIPEICPETFSLAFNKLNQILRRFSSRSSVQIRFEKSEFSSVGAEISSNLAVGNTLLMNFDYLSTRNRNIALSDRLFSDYHHERGTLAPFLAEMNRSVGRGIFQLWKRYSFFVHIIFSLLKGRPLVIYANPTNEKFVRNAILTLSIFVPTFLFDSTTVDPKTTKNTDGLTGPLTKQLSERIIIPWQKENIKFSDLATVRLIGLCKGTHKLPAAVEKYVSILDVEAETLRAPLYHAKGDLINSLLTSKKSWPSEDTFLSWVWTWWTDLCLRVSLFYQLGCVGLMTPHSSGFENILRESRDKIFRRISISNSSDIEIVEHIAELIKRQQEFATRIRSIPQSRQENHSPSSTPTSHTVASSNPEEDREWLLGNIRLDFSPCESLRNSKSKLSL